MPASFRSGRPTHASRMGPDTPCRPVSEAEGARTRSYIDQVFDLRTLRLAVGDSHRVEVPLALAPFEVGGQRYEPLPARVPGELRITRLNSGLLFDLRFHATAFGPCQRCLDEARVEIDATDRAYQADHPEPGAEDEMTTPYLAGDVLDTDRWAHDVAMLGLPDKLLCRDDCAGLCPQCGVNLNDEPGHAHAEAPDDRWAKLRDFGNWPA
jgi:DUF177 domain-containing protein